MTTLTTDELDSKDNLVNTVQLKVKSIMTLLSEIKKSDTDCDFDPSLCNDICSYINVVQTDCERVINNDYFKCFPNIDCVIQNVNGNLF